MDGLVILPGEMTDYKKPLAFRFIVTGVEPTQWDLVNSERVVRGYRFEAVCSGAPLKNQLVSMVKKLR